MTDNLMLETDPLLPLRDVVYRSLRNAILKGELEPGERLMEQRLALKLGVSRTPIREAIHMLEREGLAVTMPRRGAQVAKMTEKDLEDVLEIREALDDLAVSTASKRVTDEDIEKLSNAMVQFEKAVSRGEIREIVEADEDFHNEIYRIAGNPKLSYIVQKLKEQMYRYRYEYIKDNADYQTLIEEHMNIIKGLKEGDVDYVRGAMKEHLNNQVEGVRIAIRRRDGAE